MNPAEVHESWWDAGYEQDMVYDVGLLCWSGQKMYACSILVHTYDNRLITKTFKSIDINYALLIWITEHEIEWN